MDFSNRNEAFWDAFTQYILDEVYKTDSPSSDYLNIGGWISDIEAGDASIEEMALDVANTVYEIYGHDKVGEAGSSDQIWIMDVIEAAYAEAEKAQAGS